MNGAMKSRVKVSFRLTRDADDYPPADWEHLWAIPRDADQFELDNIPFFARGVASGDLVSARSDGDQLVFDQVTLSGGHSTVRVIMYDTSQKAAVRDELAKLGCESEGSHLPSLFSVDVPPTVDYANVISLLEGKAKADILDYEEAAIRH